MRVSSPLCLPLGIFNIRIEIMEKFFMGNGEILLYQAEDGATNLQVRLENETVWLTQDQNVFIYFCFRLTIYII